MKRGGSKILRLDRAVSLKPLLSATARGAAAFRLRVWPAGGFLLARQRGVDHRRGTAHAAIDRDRAGGAVLLAGAAFHARLGPDELSHLAVRREHPVRAHGAAHPAVDAQLWIVFERVHTRTTHRCVSATTCRFACHEILPKQTIYAT